MRGDVSNENQPSPRPSPLKRERVIKKIPRSLLRGRLHFSPKNYIPLIVPLQKQGILLSKSTGEKTVAKTKILLVEDDKNISKLVKYNLEKADLGCTLAFSGEEALSILEKTPADLVILDIMLPQIDGLEV
jgi:hypothetical protein